MLRDKAKRWLIFIFLVVSIYDLLLWQAQNRNLPPPKSLVIVFAHDNDYEDAWVQYVEDGIVQVQTVDAKTVIAFRPKGHDILFFREGWVVPVTFECVKNSKGDCDFSSPYKLFVRNLLVEVLEIKSKSG